MRVATWNIRHGRPQRGFASNRSLARTVESLDVDLLAIQEADVRVIRSWFAHQPALVARAGGADHYFYAPARRLLLVGSDGVALCVRGELREARSVELPRRNAVQRRVAIVASVVVDGTTLTVVATHLHNDAPVARHQLDALLETVASEARPRLLLGDLNLRPDDVTAPLAAAGFTLAEGGPTEPAWAPVQRLDHVAVDGAAFGPSTVPVVPVSDHRPLVVELRPPPAPSP